jgi:serine phosphatase RsbU (regulator of sigma subunit)/anti-sigma regulatory factor (Ser/Thr protein kinase)
MVSILQRVLARLTGRILPQDKGEDELLSSQNESQARIIGVDIQPDDPLRAYFVSTPGVVDVDRLQIDSQALRDLKKDGIKIAVPLVSQGELIGLLNLGARRSEQEYSVDDRRLLNTLAAQAAPALRVAQLVRQQQAEARQRERMEQELRVARIIQQTLLPRELPDVAGWQVAAHWQPARAVSGDFYDFVTFPDGRLGVAVGDVTDKGVPAALVMATTRSVLRAAAERLDSPGKILAHANNLLCPDIPPNMFVTCLYMVVDMESGNMRIANAGHNLPCQRTQNGLLELKATGMPLGLMPDMPYDEIDARLGSGDQILMYSDGLVEAHNPQREMFGFPRLRQLLSGWKNSSDGKGSQSLIHFLLQQLSEFTGPDWEQEDDVTFVVMERAEKNRQSVYLSAQFDVEGQPSRHFEVPDSGMTWRPVVEFSLPSEPGNELQAMQQVANVVQSLDLPANSLERLKTAVAETAMNAIEHGNQYRDDLPVEIQVLISDEAVAVRITDHGGDQPNIEPETPDLEAKLAGKQSPRGWGLFLIKHMVDDMHIYTGDSSHGGVHHTVELIFRR